MLRWLLGGREPQGQQEKSPVLTIGEEQTHNPYTELQVLKAHRDIVRFLVQVDDCRFASAGDDGIVYLWDVQTGERLFEFLGHTQQITAVTVFPSSDMPREPNPLILTASSDRTVIIWDCDSGRQVRRISDFHSTVKCLIVLQRLDLWLSGGSELRIWNRELELVSETSHFTDAGISTLIELPKNCIAAAIGKDLIIFKILIPTDESDKWDIHEVKCLSAHQDNIRCLVNVTELTFVSGSHVGELIVWDSLDWTMLAYERSFWDTTSHHEALQEIKLQKQKEISVQHFTTDGECVFAAIGRGIYVYNLQMKRVIAYQRTAHDSNLLHITKLPNRQIISCSEDGSVRIWEIRERQHTSGESVPTGFFSMWGFGKASKQTGQTVKKMQDNAVQVSLELIGDLIGHSSAVQMFLYFQRHGLVTCSADHLIILWKDGERESRLRSLNLFQKLEENGDLLSKF